MQLIDACNQSGLFLLIQWARLRLKIERESEQFRLRLISLIDQDLLARGCLWVGRPASCTVILNGIKAAGKGQVASFIQGEVIWANIRWGGLTVAVVLPRRLRAEPSRTGCGIRFPTGRLTHLQRLCCAVSSFKFQVKDYISCSPRKMNRDQIKSIWVSNKLHSAATHPSEANCVKTVFHFRDVWWQIWLLDSKKYRRTSTWCVWTSQVAFQTFWMNCCFPCQVVTVRSLGWAGWAAAVAAHNQ